MKGTLYKVRRQEAYLHLTMSIANRGQDMNGQCISINLTDFSTGAFNEVDITRHSNEKGLKILTGRTHSGWLATHSGYQYK